MAQLIIARSFAQHLATETGAAVYTSKLPAKPDSDDQWAVMADGGEPESGGNFLRWRKVVNLRVTYRHKSTKAVYEAEAALLTAVATFQPGSVLSRGIVPMTDTDEDAEGRHTASWQVQLTITTK